MCFTWVCKSKVSQNTIYWLIYKCGYILGNKLLCFDRPYSRVFTFKLGYCLWQSPVQRNGNRQVWSGIFCMCLRSCTVNANTFTAFSRSKTDTNDSGEVSHNWGTVQHITAQNTDNNQVSSGQKLLRKQRMRVYYRLTTCVTTLLSIKPD
jgi:hypothetical protein